VTKSIAERYAIFVLFRGKYTKLISILQKNKKKTKQATTNKTKQTKQKKQQKKVTARNI